MEFDSSPVFLNSEKITRYIDGRWDSLISCLETSFVLYSSDDGQVIQPVRENVTVRDYNGLLFSMPVCSSPHEALATKIITVYNDNHLRGLPRIQGVILLFSAVDGVLKAILEAPVITAKRTAGATAVATKYLASENPKILAILGAGVQARSHFEVLTHLYNFEEVRIWNIHQNNGEKLVKELNDKGFHCVCCSNVEEAVRDADIIVTATFSKTPILKAVWVKPGAHINVIGASNPTSQELDPELMRSAVVYTDSREAACVESGDIIISEVEVYAEIGEVILGKKEAFRDKTTVFKSLGMAVQDLVSAKLVYDAYTSDLQK
ncbi:ketimine reductase mu-crystallin-like [Limulus polyphemus]|uniref:Ketimine reductase mu-crystallin n=1 Tax=Limulus polyphemus TaxID=6850 RepID=A0ABM1B949_LIMPO|nr:ketimine reductase mu-crystallin-like [Limulus polyphemus]